MIKGSIVAVVTPMHADGTVDYKSMERLIRFHQKNGTSAVVVAGSTGESSTLDFNEHGRLISSALEYADGQIAVIAGIGANSTSEAVRLAKIAKESGAVSGLSVVPYYNKPTQEGMYQHFATVADQVDFPQILYNIPPRTVCDMENETILRLAQIPSIIGLKDATSDLARAAALIYAAPPDFALYSGDDETALAFMLLGGHGVISVTANLAPKLMSEMCDYAISGNTLKAREINKKLHTVHRILGIETNPIPVKFAMAELGMMSSGIRLPLTPLDEKYHATVKSVIQAAGISVEI